MRVGKGKRNSKVAGSEFLKLFATVEKLGKFRWMQWGCRGQCEIRVHVTSHQLRVFEVKCLLLSGRVNGFSCLSPKPPLLHPFTKAIAFELLAMPEIAESKFK